MAVPALNIPASNVTVVVAGGNGTVSPNVMLQVHSVRGGDMLGQKECAQLHAPWLEFVLDAALPAVLACVCSPCTCDLQKRTPHTCLQWTRTITPIKFVTLSRVTLTINQATSKAVRVGVCVRVQCNACMLQP